MIPLYRKEEEGVRWSNEAWTHGRPKETEVPWSANEMRFDTIFIGSGGMKGREGRQEGENKGGGGKVMRFNTSFIEQRLEGEERKEETEERIEKMEM